MTKRNNTPEMNKVPRKLSKKFMNLVYYTTLKALTEQKSENHEEYFQDRFKQHGHKIELARNHKELYQNLASTGR